MTDATHHIAAPAVLERRWYHRIPVFGLFARDLDRDFEGNIGYLALIVVSLIAIATMTWGLPALAMIALAFVPVAFFLIFLITWG